MGNSQPFTGSYAVPLAGSQTSDCTEVYRAATHPDALIENFQQKECTNSFDLFEHGLKMNSGTNRALGYRKRSDSDGSLSADFSWLTYNDVYSAARKVGSFLLTWGTAMEALKFERETFQSAKSMRLLGLFCKNRVEWLVCEQAANAYNITLVPLYDTLGSEALNSILEDTRLRCIGVSLECLPLLLAGIKKTLHTRYLLLFLNSNETVSDSLDKEMRSLGIEYRTYADVMKTSTANLLPISPGGLQDVNTICYTSGTTGVPKGVILTHRNVVSCTAGILRGPMTSSFPLSSTDCTISYLPLAHVLERLVCNAVLTLGASIGVYSGETTLLLEDVRLLNPTVFVSVPRVFNRINDAVFRGASDKLMITKYLFSKGVTTKLNSLRTNASTRSKLWDTLVFRKTKKLMGNNLRYMISGGAPLDSLIQEHMEVLFCAPLMEGYGLSETFGPSFVAHPLDPVAGHVGGVNPSCEFKLRSVPEMNYFVTSNPPRGELLIRGPSVTVGYFLAPEETNAVLDTDGWFHTGDICVLLPQGCIKIVDRKKNIFKLAQGEYIVPDKIEAAYSYAPLVNQIFVYGQSEKTYLIAIVVPDADVVKSWQSKQTGVMKTLDLKALCCDSVFKAAVKQEMDDAAKQFGLKGFEKVKDIYLESEPFSVENNLLTPTLKLRRYEAKNRYSDRIDAMYASGGD